jgi:hypothetical protein
VFENTLAAEKQMQQLKAIFTDSGLTWMLCNGRNQGAEILISTE